MEELHRHGNSPFGGVCPATKLVNIVDDFLLFQIVLYWFVSELKGTPQVKFVYQRIFSC